MLGTILENVSGGNTMLDNRVGALRIKRVIVHQHLSPDLEIFNGKHCYAQLLFQNGSRAIIQRGANCFSVSLEWKQKVRSNKICQTNCYFQGNLNDLKDRLELFILAKTYEPFQNNCYHFIIYFMRQLMLDNRKINEVQIALKQVIKKVSKTIQPEALDIATITQAARLVDDIPAVARAAYITANVGQKAGSQALAQAFKSVSGFGVVATVVGQTVVQVVQMHKKDYQPEQVAKGIGNIIVGTGGAVGGAWGGASAGAAIGVIGGPIGVIVGGVIGGVAGSVAGSTLLKNLAPWNWF